MSMNYNDFARAVELGLFPREYTYWGLGNEGRNFNMEDMYKNYKIDPTEPIRNPQLLREYQNYRTRFPKGTDEQFMNLLRRNRPDLLNYANQSFTAENLARSARLRNIRQTAANILGKGGKALGLAGLALTIPQMAQAYERNGVSGVVGETVRTTPQGMITEGALNFYIPQLNEIRNQQQLGETYLNNYNQLRNLGR